MTDNLSVVAPFAARVVSTERIDGFWIDDGGDIARWDLRRRSE